MQLIAEIDGLRVQVKSYDTFLKKAKQKQKEKQAGTRHGLVSNRQNTGGLSSQQHGAEEGDDGEPLMLEQDQSQGGNLLGMGSGAVAGSEQD